jgi:hypothetical protein
MGLVLHCADIGSVARGNFGWARLAADDPSASCSTGSDIRLFADIIAADLDAGHRVAVGFECPLFVPVPDTPKGLTSARPGEADRAWSAGAGAGSLATGLTETVWILDRVRRRVRSPHAAHTRWQPFQSGGGLFLWEAFVTKAAKADTHHGDAELAVLSFRDSLPAPEAQNAIIPAGRVRSLIGAAVLQAGWASELAWLAAPCIVIRVRPRAPDAEPGDAADDGGG